MHDDADIAAAQRNQFAQQLPQQGNPTASSQAQLHGVGPRVGCYLSDALGVFRSSDVDRLDVELAERLQQRFNLAFPDGREAGERHHAPARRPIVGRGDDLRFWTAPARASV